MANPLTTLARWFVPEVQTRAIAEYPSFETQLAAIKAQFNSPRPYRLSGVSEALGVPSILSAVSLIANTVGTLSMEAYRQNVLLKDNDVPRLVVRPNPYSTPRDFWRDTAYYLATRGEAWWWVAARDSDDVAMSLYPVPPWEVRVEANERNRLRPSIFWNDRRIPNEDMRHITYLPDNTGLRGVGPLQLAGAAVSVTVEADAWAANFYSGALPSLVATTEDDLSDEDMNRLAAQWLEKPNNVPRFLTSGLTLAEPPYDASKAQLTEIRQFQVGEVARMFDIPGSLLEYTMSGSSLTYRNEEGIWSDFQRRCLNPHYLEPVEQEVSDLLTRSTIGKFNTQQLLRSDVKTRYEVYKTGIEAGVLTSDEARMNEGLAPGNVDYAPVPLAAPQATPTLLPFQRSAAEGPVKCRQCSMKLAEAWAPGTVITCRRCKTRNENTEVRTAPDPTPSINVTPNITLTPPDFAPIEVLTSKMEHMSEVFAEFLPHFRKVALRDPATPQVTVEPPSVEVHTDSFVEAIKELKTMMSAPRTRKVIRDENNEIIGSTEEIS